MAHLDLSGRRRDHVTELVRKSGEHSPESGRRHLGEVDRDNWEKGKSQYA